MTGARYASFVAQTLFTESVSHLTESFHPPNRDSVRISRIG